MRHGAIADDRRLTVTVDAADDVLPADQPDSSHAAIVLSILAAWLGRRTGPGVSGDLHSAVEYPIIRMHG